MVCLNELTSSMTGVTITGIVIAKQDPRFVVPSDRVIGITRYVFNFTVRDSPDDWINVNCWGSKPYTFDLFERVRMHELVEIQHPQITSRRPSNPNERFKPHSQSMYELTLTEKQGFVVGGLDPCAYKQLLSIPATGVSHTYTIKDINQNAASLGNGFVSVIAIVKQVSPMRSVPIKTGVTGLCTKVKLFDDTGDSFFVTLWGEENGLFAQTWTQFTVVFFADLKVQFDSYRNCMSGCTYNCTLITVNPQTQRCAALTHYAYNVDLANDVLSSEISSIQDVFNIGKIKAILNSESWEPFQGSLHAYLTKCNLDGPFPVVTRRCDKCNFNIGYDSCCRNYNCIVGRGRQLGSPVTQFEFPIMLSDEYGSITTRLFGSVATNLLQCSAEEFLNKTEMEQTKLKNEVFLEKYTVHFQIGYKGRLQVMKIEPFEFDEDE